MIEKNRLMAITDGIIAVAATVMLLKLNIPEKVSLGAMHTQLPTLLTALISYMQIFLSWHEHHDIFAKAERIDHRVFLLNCFWLFFITLLPFVTGVMGNSPDHTPTMVVFILILAVIETLVIIEGRVVERLNEVEMQDADIIRVLRRATYVGYGVAIICAFIKPMISLIVIVAMMVVEIILVVRYDHKNEACKSK